jgi:hypothetical protein
MILKILNLSTALRILFLALLVFASLEGFGQPGNPNCPEPPCQGEVPISGIEVLIAIGAYFGVRNIFNIGKKGQ